MHKTVNSVSRNDEPAPSTPALAELAQRASNQNAWMSSRLFDLADLIDRLDATARERQVNSDTDAPTPDKIRSLREVLEGNVEHATHNLDTFDHLLTALRQLI